MTDLNEMHSRDKRGESSNILPVGLNSLFDQEQKHKLLREIKKAQVEYPEIASRNDASFEIHRIKRDSARITQKSLQCLNKILCP